LIGVSPIPKNCPKICYNFLKQMKEQNPPIVFCEWLKRRRKALDMTQDELARRAACSVGALRKIEAGERRPSKQLAALLAQALEIPDEDQQTFIRVARGELNLERIGQPLKDLPAPVADISSLTITTHLPASEVGFEPNRPSNRVPLPYTPLIGRESELAAMGKLFYDPECRLLTLTGVGGIGKTRLAIEFAARKIPQFPGGVFYIPLTSVNSPEKIVPAIADVLDYGFSGPTHPKEQLLNYLARYVTQDALFIFDNLEHLLPQSPAQDDRYGVAELVAEILERLPNVKIIGTSRERLNLHGEWTYELHGLSVPPPDYAGRLEEYDSIALFLKCAQRINSGFQVRDDEQLAIAHIARLVEGVPLAIELAAAWTDVLSCQEIAQEIQSNLDFLTTSMRDLPERHRSIRATFDHSWKLLSTEEREALCQLSVFQGGFDRNAAYQVAGASLPLLASLSAKSLVRRSGSGRYDLHELIRQYALSYLRDHPHNFETYARHSDYYLALVRDREPFLKMAAQQDAIRQLMDEIDNIRSAWTWAVNNEKYTQLESAVRAYGWYFEIAGLFGDGIEQLEPLSQALRARSEEIARHRLLGLTLILQALLYFREGEFVPARRLYEESILILRPVGDPALLADALIFLGIILHLYGEYPQAKAHLEEGLQYARECNHRWYIAYAVYNLGYIDSLLGRYHQGYEQMSSGLQVWRELGDPHYIALGLNFLVPTLIELNRIEEAIAFMQESIALCEQAKNRWGLGTAYRYLGLATTVRGDFQEAQTYLCKSLEIFSDNISGWHIAMTLNFLGYATLLDGDYSEARRVYRDALRLAMEEKAIPIALEALSGLGSLQAQRGEAEHALLIYYYILGHPSSDDRTKSRAGQLSQTLEARLDSEQILASRRIAAQKSLEQIVEAVLLNT
jgi:predicted ATPase/transcriptional regulator with XRE-family HTH domain